MGVKYNNNLKLIRENSQLTQVSVASKSNISIAHYQRLEYGLCHPSLTTARKLAKVLGTTVEELFPI